MVYRSQHLQRGFSLIESLVLVALTSILISILLPGISQVRRMAHSTQCQANQRQRNILWASVAMDIPRIPPEDQWRSFVNRQLAGSSESKKINYCPSFTRLYSANSTRYMEGNYALNSRWALVGGDGPTKSAGQPWDGVKSPSQYIWFTDIGDFTTQGLAFYDHFGWVPFPPIPVVPVMPVDTSTLGIGFHHSGVQSNVAYADGSCRPLKREELLADGTAVEKFSFGPFLIPMEVPVVLYNR